MLTTVDCLRLASSQQCDCQESPSYGGDKQIASEMQCFVKTFFDAAKEPCAKCNIALLLRCAKSSRSLENFDLFIKQLLFKIPSFSTILCHQSANIQICLKYHQLKKLLTHFLYFIERLKLMTMQEMFHWAEEPWRHCSSSSFCRQVFIWIVTEQNINLKIIHLKRQALQSNLYIKMFIRSCTL